MSANYTPEQREELLRQFEEWRAEGSTALDAAKKIGVSYVTLLAWQKKLRQPELQKDPVPGNVPLQPEKGKVVLTTPNGLQIKGTCESVVKILKRLRDEG